MRIFEDSSILDYSFLLPLSEHNSVFQSAEIVSTKNERLGFPCATNISASHENFATLVERTGRHFHTRMNLFLFLKSPLPFLLVFCSEVTQQSKQITIAL